jgi:hypothetical protein
VIASLLRRVHRDYRDSLTTRQRSGLVAYLSYGVTIAAVRGLTAGIKDRRLPLHDITIGGMHLHHYVPGIALLTGTGAAAIRGSDKASVHCMTGAAYGTGCALITDELPSLLNLRDVYWTRQGRWSVELALVITAIAGAYFSGIPLWRGLRDEVEEQLGRIRPVSPRERRAAGPSPESSAD